jgi:PAS domain S-box-containing protein
MRLDSFIPHGFCLAWDPGLVALQAASDVLIAIAYYSIPAALLVFLRRRHDLAFRGVFGLFAAFILACGTTHILAVITLFTPVYWTDGIIKAITASLSIATAVTLWPLLPKAIALPSPAALETLNAQLAREVQDRDQATIQLRNSQQRLRDLYARSPAMLHATDDKGIILEVSQRWLDLFGYERGDVVGRSMKEFYAPGTVGNFPDNVDGLIRDPNQPPRERKIVLRSGEIRDAEAVYTLELDDAGTVRRILVALTDVTDRKRAEAALRQSEERLRHAQKMEAVGQLTGGIAHDFNNLLTTIMASLELLEQRGTLDAHGHRMAGNALEGARRAARLTSQLLSFSRRSRLTPATLYPEDVVQGIAALLTQTTGGRIDIGIDPAPPGLWAIRADSNQLEAAVLNLVINARDAIRGDGSMRVSFANRLLSAEEGGAMRPDPLPAGDYVGITVTDTGSGMTEDVLARALEPFFTTKAPGAGTGLGLSQSYGFAAQSGGTLRLSSAPGRGTIAEILLPRAAGDVQRPAAPTNPPPSRGVGETIVFAEDDALLRHTVSEILRGHGYVVETAASGAEALDLLRSLTRIDLLLTDIMMPGGMNGVELALAARRIDPDLRVMFATGYSDQDILAQWPEALDVVNKPFALDQLISRVATRLAGTLVPGNEAARAEAPAG